MSNIYDLANELNRSFRELPEYKAVLESKASIDTDGEAKALFKDYVDFQGKIQQMMQTGQMPTPELQEEMKNFSEKIQQNSLLTDFFNKQQQVSIYLSDIERIVFEPVQDLMK